MRPGVRKLFARHGYRYWGQTSRGEDVWATEFGEPDRVGLSPSAAGATAIRLASLVAIPTGSKRRTATPPACFKKT